MGEKTPSFPLGPALVLFGIIGILLIALLSGQPQIPPAAPATPTVVAVVPSPTATQQQAQPVASLPYTDAQIKQGQALFAGTCAACHGPDARGIPGLGKNLAASTFVHGLNDADLLKFISTGRPVTDPLNTTGIAMPARGGNPSFTDDQLRLIIAYVRSQQAKNEQAAAAPTATPGVAATSKPFVLPITGMNLSTATPSEQTAAGAVTAAPTQAPTTVPTTAPTENQPTTATPTNQGGFRLPIEGMNLSTATPSEAVAPGTATPTSAGGFRLPIEGMNLSTMTPSPTPTR